MGGVTQTPISTDARRRASRPAGLAAFAVAAGLVVGAFVWSAPRDDVPVPGPEATPEQVVRAYIDAVNARDFDTANAIDARPGEDLGRFSRPMQTHEVEMGETAIEGAKAHVLFTSDFDGGDGTVEDGLWGYVLERGDDGLWHIIDAGVV
jgi:hypothetical protein